MTKVVHMLVRKSRLLNFIILKKFLIDGNLKGKDIKYENDFIRP
jgi:hypothetical protein